ncbi:hypothetical protein [Lacipirellula parvula]|jgi:hypothetical protein|uniref:Uncharacterized protein n=1 Tax=Lacipirellula parvula TaxID=2650471 RepID=A0A5K7XGM5_9BACT|nr:hypothetical protein [Lacipirellula parvula]BBO32119.1 hypothetical protein PLANPX_1731 [Lacipirellula parvula]
MLHFTCDCCKRVIDPERELRYVVRLEVYAALDPMDSELEDEHDHLQEIQDILDRLDDAEDERISDDVYQQKRYDLCSKCRNAYLKNPLGRVGLHELGFSQN